MCADCRLSAVVRRGSTRVRLSCLSSSVLVVFCFHGVTCAFLFRSPFAIIITHHWALKLCMWDRVRLCGFRVNFPSRRERAPPVQQPWRTRVPWTTLRNRLRRSVSGNSQRKSAENYPAGCRSSPKCPIYLTLSSPALKVRPRRTKSFMASPRPPLTVLSSKRMRLP